MTNEAHGNKPRRIALYAGVGAVALIIGLLTGISSSPVVGILMPLVFSVLTAGGTIYVSLVRKSEAGNIAGFNSSVSPETLGKQLLCFSLGFLLGLWPGVQAKLTPSLFWHVGSDRMPAYSSGITFQDPRLLAAAMKLDSAMIASGLDYEQRRSILSSTSSALAERRRQTHSMDSKVEEINNHLEKLKRGLVEIDKLVDAKSLPKSALHDKGKQTLPTLSELVAELHEEHSAILRMVESVKEAGESRSSVGLLSSDEVKALEPILTGKADNGAKFFFDQPVASNPSTFYRDPS